jgi:hypothetical protein
MGDIVQPNFVYKWDNFFLFFFWLQFTWTGSSDWREIYSSISRIKKR